MQEISLVRDILRLPDQSVSALRPLISFKTATSSSRVASDAHYLTGGWFGTLETSQLQFNEKKNPRTDGLD